MCTYIYANTYTYIHLYTYTCTPVHIQISLSLSLYIYIYICQHISMRRVKCNKAKRCRAQCDRARLRCKASLKVVLGAVKSMLELPRCAPLDRRSSSSDSRHGLEVCSNAIFECLRGSEACSDRHSERPYGAQACLNSTSGARWLTFCEGDNPAARMTHTDPICTYECIRKHVYEG